MKDPMITGGLLMMLMGFLLSFVRDVGEGAFQQFAMAAAPRVLLGLGVALACAGMARKPAEQQG